MTKRRLASFLAASIGNDVPNCTNQAAGERVGVIPSIAAWLAEKVRQFDALEWIATPDGLRRTGSYPVSAFHGRPLSASIQGFLHRICTLAQLEESVVLVAAVYLERIIKKCPTLPISSCTVHRLLLQAVAIGAKFCLDQPRSNKVMASFADLAPKKYNQCEVKFLCLIQYDLTVKPDDLEQAKKMIGMVEQPVAVEVIQQYLPVYKKAKLGEHCGTTYSTMVLGATEEESAVYSEDSEVDAMSHLEESNNYSYSEGVRGLVTPTLSTCSSPAEDSAVSPQWSNQSSPAMGEDSPSNNSVSTTVPEQTQQQHAAVQGFLASKAEAAASSPEPNKMSMPERRAAFSNLVATAAE